MRSLASLSPGPVIVLGRIISFPMKVPSNFGKTNLRFHLQCERIVDREGGRGVGRVSVTMPSKGEALGYGDRIIFSGEVLRTSLQREGLSGQIFVQDERDCLIISRCDRNNIMFRIFQLKEYLENKIDGEISSPENSILKAMLLGSQEGITPELREEFSKSGTAHLLAIAGLHTGIVALIFMAILRLLGLSGKRCCGIAVILIAGYCILTGARTSVVRATIMIVLMLLGIIVNRECDMVASLSWAAILLLIREPLDLFEPAFQLSFLTVLSIITLFPKTQDQKSHGLMRFTYFLKETLKVSISAWMGIAPLIAFYFYLVSPITVIANLFVVPYLGIVIGSGFAFLFLGPAGTFFSRTLGCSCWWITKFLIEVCAWFSKIPYGNFRCPPPTPMDFAMFYGLFFLWINRDALKIKYSTWTAVLLLSANIFIWKGNLKSRNRDLSVTFLNVGHGDSAVIEFPQKGVLLIDTGAGGECDQGRMTVAPFLWRRGITRLDGIIITHPHFDHYGGLKYILKEFEVGVLFDNGDRSKTVYNQYSFRPGLNRKVLNVCDRIIGADRIGIRILHPPESYVKDTSLGPNDQSVVLALGYGRARILMGGDAERIALGEINRRGFELNSQILKVPHHGSWSKEEEEIFLCKVRPKIAVISEAETNMYHLPNKKTVDYLRTLGTDIYQTGFTGSVQFQTDGKAYKLNTGQ